MTSQDSAQNLAKAIRSGDRTALPRAITLLESTRADHRERAQQLLLELLLVMPPPAPLLELLVMPPPVPPAPPVPLLELLVMPPPAPPVPLLLELEDMLPQMHGSKPDPSARQT